MRSTLWIRMRQFESLLLTIRVFESIAAHRLHDLHVDLGHSASDKLLLHRMDAVAMVKVVIVMLFADRSPIFSQPGKELSFSHLLDCLSATVLQ